MRREWRAAGPLGGIARPLIGFGGKRGAKTPLAEIALIKERLRRARAHHEGVEEP